MWPGQWSQVALRGVLGLTQVEVSPLRTAGAGGEGNEAAPLLLPGTAVSQTLLSVGRSSGGTTLARAGTFPQVFASTLAAD